MSKYRNVRCVIDGVRYDSFAEGRRGEELRLLERVGKIANLRIHPKYDLHVRGVKVGTYAPDFDYLEPGRGIIVEDVKGVRTAVYKLKKKIFEAEYGMKITEIDA